MAYRSVLVGVTGSPASEVALRRAVDVARGNGGRLTVLGVQEPEPIFAESRRPDQRNGRLDAAVQAAVAVARRAGVAAEGHVLAGYPAEVIVRWCVEHGCDLVVLGASDDDAASIGRTADRVADLAPCAVLVAR
jgi:nucleotide-binding universal stress UspA family protein